MMVILDMIICAICSFLIGFYTNALMVTRDRKELKRTFEVMLEKERKTGKWIDTADEYDKRARRHDYYCSECRTFARYFISGYEDWWCGSPPKYCPNCGLKMEVDE